MNGNSAMQSLYARAKFYGVGIRQGFDFWRFHTPTTIIFGVFGKFSGVYYAKTPTNASPAYRPNVAQAADRRGDSIAAEGCLRWDACAGSGRLLLGSATLFYSFCLHS